ncbi:MAG: PhzF family phenazine biosynthesis protein [Asgard group archaeon]|nr:PhzF family phenazine biosynthesis protein [Asgard group archaeon]
MKKLPYIQTSVFVDNRFSFTGNQLATFIDKEKNAKLTTEEMQGIALELNYSETTFILDTQKEGCSVKVRIFTPGSELKFAGHPTIGTAFVLKESELIESEIKETTMELGIGPIRVTYNDDSTISMFQNQPEFLDKFEDKETIAKILGIKPEDILDDFPMQFVSTGFPFLIVPIKDLETIKSINIDAQLQISALQEFITSKIIAFSSETDFKDSSVHVRMFAPEVGVIEDPATGSAAGPLGAYLEQWNVLENHEKTSEMRFEQGFEIKRPSQLIVRNQYENKIIKKVVVSGKTRKTAMGEFFL